MNVYCGRIGDTDGGDGHTCERMRLAGCVFANILVGQLKIDFNLNRRVLFQCSGCCDGGSYL